MPSDPARRAAAIAKLQSQPWGPMMLTFTAIDGSTVTPTTRADLMKHPAFADLAVDSDGNPCVWENHYTSGRRSWQTEWSCMCDDDGWVPYSQLWIGPDLLGGPLYRLWESLPEAGATYPTPILPGAMVKTPADQPQPMWLCVWVTNYGDNDLRDSFTIHESEAEAQKAYDLLMPMENLHCAAIAPIHKATEPHWQDQR
jgi:hypothetical protein